MFLENLKLSTRINASFALMSLLMLTAIGLALGQTGPAPAVTRWELMALGAVGITFSLWMAWGLGRSIERPLDEAILIAETVASGDLSHDFETERGGEFGRLLRALGTMEDTLTDLVTRIKQSTEPLTTASREIATDHAHLADRTADQATSLKQTAEGMSDLTATVRQNAERARSANGLAAGASALAEQGGTVVGQVVQTMDAISTSSRKIVDIIEVIDGIAFQTNILALNAAVEAARAGDQGRGFAVVAGEVRGLAQRSSEAAREIKTLIGSSVQQVENGAQLVSDAGRTMQQIVEAVRRVTGILGEISAASAQQSEGIGQVSEAVLHVDAVTQQNAVLVQQAADAAGALARQAHDLQAAVDQFKV